MLISAPLLSYLIPKSLCVFALLQCFARNYALSNTCQASSTLFASSSCLA